MTPLRLQQLNRLPQPRRRLAVVPRRHALIREVRGVDDLRLDAGVGKPVAVSGNLSDAAYEVAVRVARLPVVRVVDADDRADFPVEMLAFGGALHGSGIQLRQQQWLARLCDVRQNVPVAAQRTEEVKAVLVNFRLGLPELEIGSALLARDHAPSLVDGEILP